MKRLRKAEDGCESVEASNNKGEGVLSKIGVKFKQSEPDTSSSSGGEMEGLEGVVWSFEPCIDGHRYDKDKFSPEINEEGGTMSSGSFMGGFRLVGKYGGCFCVGEGNPKWFVCVSSDQRAQKLGKRPVSLFALRYRALLKGVISGVVWRWSN